MLVKYNVSEDMPETEKLAAQIDQLAARERELLTAIATTQEQEQKTRDDIDAVSQRLAQTQRDLATAQARTESLRELDKTTPAPAPPSKSVPQPDSRVGGTKTGEQDYLIGLRVQGKRIGILLDSSASMTDERLIDIIRRKNGSQAQKRQGPKWQRALAATDWLMARVPATSRVTLVSFNDTAVSHIQGTGLAGSDTGGLQAALARINAITPQGATNLQVGLEAIGKTRPTDLYLITDGLPTQGDGGYKSLNPFSTCPALWGRSAKISGPCRVKLFQHTIKNAGSGFSTVHVILLPIEGDPAAAEEYWRWSADTGGMLISPAPDWP